MSDSFRIVDAREFADFLMVLDLEPVSGSSTDTATVTRYGKPDQAYLAEIEESGGMRTYKIRIR